MARRKWTKVDFAEREGPPSPTGAFLFRITKSTWVRRAVLHKRRHIRDDVFVRNWGDHELAKLSVDEMIESHFGFARLYHLAQLRCDPSEIILGNVR